MELKEAIQILKEHNEWRRYNSRDICLGKKMVNPTELGIAIDTVVKAYKNK